MGIELRIMSATADGENTTSVKQINERDITVGCYNDDNVKLKSQLLQGSHVRISSEWNAATDEQRLIITNISGNTTIFVNNEALESDEYREISEKSEIRLGRYTLAARDTSMNYFILPEETNSDFALESFSPNEFSLDTAMQSLLQPTEQVQEHKLPPTPEAIIDKTVDTMAKAPTKLIENPSAVETKQSDVVTTEIPMLQVAKKPAQSTDTGKVASLSSDAMHQEQDESIALDSTKKQTLFTGVVGIEDIVELNFDAFRLYSISGRIIHHDQPLSGVVLDGGALGATKTNANGHFCFENIVEGTDYQINVSCNGYMMSKTQVLSGTINDNIEHELNAIKLSRIAGRIVHDGSPLPGITLDAGPYGICLTDAEGYYHFDDVPENTDLEIRALGEGFMFKRAGSTVAAQRPPSAVVKPAAASAPAAPTAATPNNAPAPSNEYTDQQLEDSLAALVGDQQNVA